MGTLVLVRHGQASFLADDYDKLSPLGEQQARQLGAHWVERGVGFDAVYVGPRQRQRHTAALVGEVFRAAGQPWPEPSPLDDLDEMQADVAFRHALPRLAADDPAIGALVATLPARLGPEHGRTVNQLFEAVSRRWVRGELALDGVEPWPDFVARVRRAIDHMRGQAPRSDGDPATEGAGRGRRVVGFTSGGTTSAAVQYALRTDDAATFELALIIRNSALTEFLFSGDRFTLSSFNHTPHLDHPSLVTYR